jgi:N-succinyldiaminopimelate aminotransferase
MAERTLTLSSLGKTFSLTGWKIGWAIGSPELSAAVRSAHQFLTFATSTPLQVGAAAALARVDESEQAVRGLVETLRAGRETLAGALARLGLTVFRPAGAYFVIADFTSMPRCRSFSDDQDFCRTLTAEAGVAAIPPSVFYQNREHGRSLARFAFCKRSETLIEAVRRLEVWAARH